MTSEKSREDRLRRTAARRGWRLYKCRRRDPLAIGYGTYELADQNNHCVACGPGNEGYGLNLDEIEEILNKRP